MPETIISQVNALGQGQPNDLELLDCKTRPIVERKITGVYAGETEAPHIELVETKTDLNPVLDESETLLELLEWQDILTIKE